MGFAALYPSYEFASTHHMSSSRRGGEWFRRMPDLLFELFSEEIPARMQMRAAEDLKKAVTDRLVDAGLLADCLDDAARRGGMKPIGAPVLYRFQGGGLTGYLLLSESHIAFHTYPEHRFLALDIFSCGSADSKAALSVFLAALEPGREHLTTAPRGAEIPQRD